MYNNKIDLHSHFLPPSYVEYLQKYESAQPDNFATPEWSEDAHIKLMDSLGVAFSLISISSPNLSNASDEVEKEYARRINDEGAAFVKKYPDRVGLMAELPLPNIENSIAEATYALDTIGAMGFGLKTHYRGKYLGNTDFDPLMKFLNERKAVIVVHPTAPYQHYEEVNENFPIPAFEFFVETTRTFINLVLNDTFLRYPDIRWAFPHAGAFISIISDRFDAFSLGLALSNPDCHTNFFKAMKHAYFDLAGFPLPKQIQILKQNVPSEHMLYGSDCPYTPGPAIIALAGALEETRQFSTQEKEKIFTDNALALFPQLSKTIEPYDKTVQAVAKRDSLRNSLLRRLLAILYRLYSGKKPL